MLSETQAREAIGGTAYDNAGNKVGTVGQIYLDDETGRPEFMTVNTGLFGTKESFVPVENATMEGDSITVPFGKDQIKDAPSMDLDGEHLDRDGERRLFEHYDMGNASDVMADTTIDTTAGTTTGTTDRTTSAGLDTADGRTEVGHDTSGPTTDDAMTRSEEHLEVGTTSQEAGRVRLRKYVTTEMETHTVPVRKERAVLETEPITDANRGQAEGGPSISEEEHEVVLHEEVPVVEKRVEAVERVRLGTETATEEKTVTDEVRTEHIEADGDVTERR